MKPRTLREAYNSARAELEAWERSYARDSELNRLGLAAARKVLSQRRYLTTGELREVLEVERQLEADRAKLAHNKALIEQRKRELARAAGVLAAWPEAPESIGLPEPVQRVSLPKPRKHPKVLL